MCLIFKIYSESDHFSLISKIKVLVDLVSGEDLFPGHRWLPSWSVLTWQRAEREKARALMSLLKSTTSMLLRLNDLRV